ncbi:Chaperone DnaJ-domain superfamily protein isoform 1 [Hibiscus syriacus]|uniref:Chaperone DnaJ-domain superfamily protein isoform 1 n=1 Tax=Hibiscus syriacus TaxID=106335 RepID=A0A6A3BKL6_HIBSY|nr:Chaperone DnaJ-domain superfamily protein isoform 1 [Hibiscus syriacus]
MSRRPVNPSRPYGDAGGGAALFSLSKPRSPPFVAIFLTVLGVLIIVAYFHSGSGSALKNLVSRVEDYLSPRYLNKTLPDFCTGFPGQRKAKAADVSKYGRAAKLRSSTWWARYFVQTSLEENEVAAKKFSSAAEKSSYTPNCQNFHLRSYH